MNISNTGPQNLYNNLVLFSQARLQIGNLKYEKEFEKEVTLLSIEVKKNWAKNLSEHNIIL